MKKLIAFLNIFLLSCNLCFSQTEINDSLSNEIEVLKQNMRDVGLTSLDKIEGIYKFKMTGRSYGWSPDFLNRTYNEYVYFYITKFNGYTDMFQMFEYQVYRNKFNWVQNTIQKVENKYLIYTFGKSFDPIKNEIVFLENNISFKLETKTRSGNSGSEYYYEGIKKIYPSSLEDNIFKTGTGFFISKNGYIVTNYHVVENSSNIYASNQLFNRLKVQEVFVDKYNDLVLLKADVSLNNIPYNILSAPTEIGNNVFTLGYPYIQSMGKEVKLTNGIINSNSGFENDTRYYQFSAEIQPGNSGGPLFDSEGNIVGLVSAKHTQATNAGYALKSNFVMDFIKMNDPSIIKNNKSSLKNLSLSSKYKILKDYVLLLEIE